MALPLIFDFYNSIIEVPAPDTSLTMQYLINEVRDNEDELIPGMAYNKIADASGKEDLGGGVSTAITVRLLDNWRVRFEARPSPTTVQCTISGGNLVGGLGGNPIAPSAFTQVLNLSSAAGTIATPTTASENTNIKYLLASMGTQKTIGNIYYWDPHSGSDSNTGLAPTTAVQTFAKAITLVASGNHDIIFCLSSDPTGVTTVTETINININTLKLKGPGHVFQFAPITTTADTITISGNDVEISGFYVSTAATGTKNAITVTGDNALIKDCWISGVQGSGINVTSSTLTIIETSAVENCGNASGNGITIGADTIQTLVSKCIISDSPNGVSISGANIADNILENNLIYNHTGYGISIAAGPLRTHVRSGHTFSKNTLGDTNYPTGYDTYVETQAGGLNATQVANAVWNEVISSHVTSGTTGKTLKDAKTKATLASLK